MVRVKYQPATNTDATPAQAVHFIFPKVRILPTLKAATAETATKTAVHVPCAETAFNPIDVLNNPEPQQKIQSMIEESECSKGKTSPNTHKHRP